MYEFIFNWSFLVGWIVAWFMSFGLWTFLQWNFRRKLYENEEFNEILEYAMDAATGERAREAVIQKEGPDDYRVYDKQSGRYLCKFKSWKTISSQLIEIANVSWKIEYNDEEIEELKKKEMSEK